MRESGEEPYCTQLRFCAAYVFHPTETAKVEELAHTRTEKQAYKQQLGVILTVGTVDSQTLLIRGGQIFWQRRIVNTGLSAADQRRNKEREESIGSHHDCRCFFFQLTSLVPCSWLYTAPSPQTILRTLYAPYYVPGQSCQPIPPRHRGWRGRFTP